MTVVINLFGGPGVGKSTTAASLFSLMKLEGESVELVTEYAKDLFYAKDVVSLGDQLNVLSEQHKRIRRLNNQVDFIITDSPILMNLAYKSPDDIYPESFDVLVRDTFEYYENFNVVIERCHAYNGQGRFEDEVAAIKRHQDIINLGFTRNYLFKTPIDKMEYSFKVRELYNEIKKQPYKPYGQYTFPIPSKERFVV